MEYKWQKITFSILTVISIIFIIFLTQFLKKLIQSQANHKALLTEDTNNLWAYFPGQSEVKIYRDSQFYNIPDTNDFLTQIKSKKQPKIKETRAYRTEEDNSWLFREYSTDKSTVKFHPYKRHYQISDDESAKQEDLITTFNLPAMGVWYQAKNIPRQNAALTALYSLYSGLLNDFYYQACQTALADNAYTTYELFESSFINKLSYLPETTKKALYEDSKYGFKTKNGFFSKVFVNYDASKSNPNNFSSNSDFEFFRNYFSISYFEMYYFYQNYNDKIKHFLPIGKPFLVDDISRENIAANQWLNLGMLDDSIYGQNSTIPGYVEYGGFLKKEKKIEYTSTLSISKVKQLLALNDFDPKEIYEIDNLEKNQVLINNIASINKRIDDSKSLFKKSNMDSIMSNSLTFEQQKAALMKLCEITDDTEAGYLIEYLNYISGEMAFQYSRSGKKEYTALATLFTQGIFPVLHETGHSLFHNLLAKYSFELVFSQKSCLELLPSLMYPESDIEKICSNENLTTEKESNIRDVWITGIIHKDEKLKTLLGYNDAQFRYISNPNSYFSQKFLSSFDMIKTKYGVTGTTISSVDYTPLIISQFVTGSISLNEFNLVSVRNFTRDSDEEVLFNSAPEYSVFCKEEGIENEFTEEDIKLIMNFDGLFSQLWVMNRLIEYDNNDGKAEVSKFSSINFINYIRRIVFSEVFNNLFVTKTVNDFLWGYDDFLLSKIKTTNYYIGGDPTIVTKFSFLQNKTEPPVETDTDIWEVSTGVKDTKQIRQYTKSNGVEDRKITMKDFYFDGDSISELIRNPWKEDMHLNGTDAMAFNPGLTKQDRPWCFVEDLFRPAVFNFYNTKKYHDLELYRFTLDDSLLELSEYNSNFYMEKYEGFGNQTSVYKAPMFVSKPYYNGTKIIDGSLYCDIDKFIEDKSAIDVKNSNDSDNSHIISSFLANNNSITNNFNENKLQDNDDLILYNQSWIDVEPISGAVLRAGQKILVSLLIEKDILFDFPNDLFVPVNFVFRNGNVTEHGINNFLGDLYLAKSIKFWGIIIFAALGGISLIILIVVCVFKKKKSNKSNSTFINRLTEDNYNDTINNSRF